MSVLTITLGTTAQLQIKVPVKGETNWSETFKTEFAQKIVEHDHTGVDGKGAKISTAALEDNAVTTAKLDTDAVTTDKIDDLNVTTAKLADNSVTNAKMGADVLLATLSDVSATSPSSGQVLKWSGSEWAPATDQTGSGGGSITTIANQTDANSYSPSEGDVLKVTANVTFTDVTFNKIDIYVADTITLKFLSSDINDCKIVGGELEFKGTSTYTTTSTHQTTGIDSFSIKRTQIFCEDISLEQELDTQSGVVTTTLEEVFINCRNYRYQVAWLNDSDEIGDDNDISTTSNFRNVTIFAKGTMSLGHAHEGSGGTCINAIANYTNVLTSGLSSLANRRDIFPLDPMYSGFPDYEHGIKTNVKKITTTSG